MDATGVAVMCIYVFALFIGRHRRAVACTVTSHQEDCGFEPGPFCVEFTWSPCASVGSQRVHRLPPTVQGH